MAFIRQSWDHLSEWAPTMLDEKLVLVDHDTYRGAISYEVWNALGKEQHLAENLAEVCLFAVGDQCFCHRCVTLKPDWLNWLTALIMGVYSFASFTDSMWLTLGNCSRAVLAGVETSQESIAVDGHLSLAHIQSKDPDMARAAVDGWKWNVIHHSCRGLYGDILYEILSDTKNIKLARAESEMQVLNKISNMASAYQAKNEPIAWDQIHASVCRTKPPCQNYVSVLIQFVKRYSGGVGGPFVQDYVRFHRRFVPHERFVGGQFFDFITNWECKDKGDKTPQDKGHGIPAILLRFAILKGQNSCPAARVINGECQQFSKGDIESTLRKSPKSIFDAEALLVKSREITDGLSTLSSEDRVYLFGKLDTNVVRVLFKKQETSKVKYDSIEAAACDFFKELKDLVPSLSIANPWHKPSDPNDQGQATKDIRNEMPTFSNTGQLVSVDAKSAVQIHGVEVGSFVKPESGKGKNSSMRLLA